MAGATEGLDLNQALDVQSDITTQVALDDDVSLIDVCLLYTSPSPRDA